MILSEINITDIVELEWKELFKYKYNMVHTLKTYTLLAPIHHTFLSS